MKAPSIQSTDLPRLLQSDVARLSGKILNVLLIVWIAWMLATMTWSLIGKQEPPESALPEIVPTTPQAKQQDELVLQIPSWHLFGEVAAEVEPVKTVVPVDAPDTRLKLSLRGTFSSADPELARAIIADERGNEEMYAVGDLVPGNAELSEIQDDKVILMRGGRYETLRLPRESVTGSSGVPVISATTASHSDTTSTRLQSLRQNLRQNPKSLFGLVRPIPKKDAQGKMVGYVLQPGREAELFNQMGLEPGDIVTRINDVSLNNVASGMQALRSVQTGDTVTMTVLRGDQQKNLTFKIPE